MMHPNVRLYINPMILLHRNMNGHECARNRPLTRGIEGYTGPLSPVSNGARNYHACWRDLHDLAASSDMNPQPGVRGQAVCSYSMRVFANRCEWFEMFRCRPHRRKQIPIS